jgi:hypothetical protein
MLDILMAIRVALIILGVFFFYKAGGQTSTRCVMAVGLGFLAFVLASWAWMLGA